MSDLKEEFERSCRLCAEEQDVTLMIFSAEAEAMLLKNKLNKYLLIEVDEDDKLPKNICIQCCTKLQTVCDFIDTVHKSQEVLAQRSLEIDRLESLHVNYEGHEILSTQLKSEPEDCLEEEDSKMEISVDPMIILQNCEAMSPPPDITYYSHHEDVSHLHGLDGENVTIKLIKKGDHSESENGFEQSYESLTCQICRQIFETDSMLQKHYRNHDAYELVRQDYTCSVCNQEFIFKNKLIQHLKIHKTSGICKICGRLFRTADKLATHMAVHKHESLYSCKICGRSYDSLSNLKTHNVSHSNERPYECHICPKTFKRNQDLKFHINQHTGAKPYKCPFCDKAFASSGNCYSHRSRMHPGRAMPRSKKKAINKEQTKKKEETSQYTVLHPRPIAPKPPPKAKATSTLTKPAKYKCHLCAHTFMKRDNYTYHMYQHTGEKPFHCSFCSEEFVTRRGLLIHHDNKHPTKNRPLALLTKNVLLM